MLIVDFLYSRGMAESKVIARQLIKAGYVSINLKKIEKKNIKIVTDNIVSVFSPDVLHMVRA